MDSRIKKSQIARKLQTVFVPTSIILLFQAENVLIPPVIKAIYNQRKHLQQLTMQNKTFKVGLFSKTHAHKQEKRKFLKG